MLINLLPRKSSVFENHKKDLIIFAAAMLVPCLLLSIWFVINKKDVMELKEQLASYREEIDSFSKVVRQADTHTASLTDFNDYQLATLKILSLLGKTFGNRVCLAAMAREKNKLVLSGSALSVSDLTMILQKLAASGDFANISVKDIKKKNSNYIYRVTAHEKNASPALLGAT